VRITVTIEGNEPMRVTVEAQPAGVATDAAHSEPAADRYVFLALKGDDAEPLGIISADGFKCCARLIRRGEPITERFTAHYDMYVCDTRALDDLAAVLDSLAPPGVVV